MFDFNVVGGTTAREIIAASRSELVSVVRDAYLAHHQGDSVNPNSYFLRFPEKPSARIIALPAYLGGNDNVAGIKWIGSFPENIESNIPRASAVLLLNDYATGYPFACLEASQISAARTAASAVLGARELLGSVVAEKIAVVGSGIIARNIIEFFAAEGWRVGDFALHDKVPAYAESLAAHTRDALGYGASVHDDLGGALKGADVRRCWRRLAGRAVHASRAGRLRPRSRWSSTSWASRAASAEGRRAAAQPRGDECGRRNAGELPHVLAPHGSWQAADFVTAGSAASSGLTVSGRPRWLSPC
ncbi:Alanine dehydrogenase [Streptomyces badius]